MFDFYRKMMGVVEGRETDTEVQISGIDGVALVRDINKHWKTEKISMYMFNSVSRSSISFYKFFALEMLYMIEEIKNYRNRYTSVKTMAAIKEALLTSTWLKNTLAENTLNQKGRLDFSRLSNLKFTASAYQMDYFKNYTYKLDQYGMKGNLLDAAAGTGKTYMSAAIAEMLNSKHIIVLCPKNALETVWPESVAEMFKTPQTLWHSGDKELGGFPARQEFTGQRWIVAHYEAINKVLQFVDKVGTKNVTIILDESHNLNDETALRTQMYSQLCRDTKSVNIIEQSGTALKAMGAELIPFIRLIDDLFTAEVEFRFKKIFGKEAKKGADIIRNRLQAISFKIEKKETDLKPPIMRAHAIKIPNGEAFTLDSIKVDAQNFIDERWKYYKARRKVDEAFWAKALAQLKQTQKGPKEAAMKDYLRDLDIVCKAGMVWQVPDQLKACTKYEKEVFEKCLPQAWVKEFRDVKSVIKYTNLKIQGECLGRIIGGKRIEAHVAMVPYIDWVGIIESTEKKTLVFSSFVEAIEACDTHWRKIGYTPLTVYGKFTNQLGPIVKQFDDDKNANPLGATYASLSTAVRLTMADTMIMVNSPFRHYILEQAVSRIYRIGQDSQCYVYQVSLDTGDKPNISTRSKDILAWSQEMVASLMGLESNFIEGDNLPALESVFQKHEYDENKALHAILQGSFDNLGIEISKEDFDVTKVVNKMPGYMNW